MYINICIYIYIYFSFFQTFEDSISLRRFGRNRNITPDNICLILYMYIYIYIYIYMYIYIYIYIYIYMYVYICQLFKWQNNNASSLCHP